MKAITLLVLLLSLTGCSLPVAGPATAAVPTDAIVITTPSPFVQPTAQPGTSDNPLILALTPSHRPSEAAIAASEELTGLLGRLTGYAFVAVAPSDEVALVDALGADNAHVAVLTPFGYLAAHRRGSVTAGLASVRDGRSLYGAQLIANRTSQFEAHLDEELGQNTTTAENALLQFRNRKPCWSEYASPSGHVVPLGYLNQVKAFPTSGAFLEGQPSVVRAVYAEGICDFGATFVDARTSPALEEDYPDVLERVVVIWRIPEIIPYEVLVFAADLPIEMRRVLLRAFVDVMLDPGGKAAMQTIYGIEALQPAEDSLYAQFDAIATASGLPLESLMEADDL